MRNLILGLGLALGVVTPGIAAGPDFSNRQDFDFADRGRQLD